MAQDLKAGDVQAVIARLHTLRPSSSESRRSCHREGGIAGDAREVCPQGPRGTLVELGKGLVIHLKRGGCRGLRR